MCETLKVPKNTLASIILKWKKFGTTKTLPVAGRPVKLRKLRENGNGEQKDGYFWHYKAQDLTAFTERFVHKCQSELVQKPSMGDLTSTINPPQQQLNRAPSVAAPHSKTCTLG
jgi:hypothetical protein